MSIWQLRAAARFPRSAKRGRIFGDGKFVLGIQCGDKPKILLYPSAEARQYKLAELAERGCGYDCVSDHKITELSEE
jgi:hypothetical protein